MSSAKLPGLRYSRAWFHARQYATLVPTIYQPFARWRYPANSLQPDTEIVFDGYTRTGTTFFAEAFLWAQKRPVRAVWAFHDPGAVVVSGRRGLPCVVTIRRPDSVAVSQKVVQPQLTFADILKGFIRFYSYLQPHRAGILVLPIEQTRRDIGAAIEAMNAKFGCDYVPFEHTEANVSAVREVMKEQVTRRYDGEFPAHELRYVGFPVREKGEVKRRAAAEFEAADLDELRKRAREVYDRFLAGSGPFADCGG